MKSLILAGSLALAAFATVGSASAAPAAMTGVGQPAPMVEQARSYVHGHYRRSRGHVSHVRGHYRR